MFKIVRLTIFILSLAKCGHATSLKILTQIPNNNNNFVKCTCADGLNYEKSPSGSLLPAPYDTTFDSFSSPVHPEIQEAHFPNSPRSCLTHNEVLRRNFSPTKWAFAKGNYPIPMGVHSIENHFPENEDNYPGYPFSQNKVKHHNFPQINQEFLGGSYPMPLDVHSFENNFPQSAKIFPGYPVGQKEAKHHNFLQTNSAFSGESYPMPLNVHSIENNLPKNANISPEYPVGQEEIEHHNFPQTNWKFPRENSPLPIGVQSIGNPFPENDIFSALPLGQNQVKHNNFPYTNWKSFERRHQMPKHVHIKENYFPQTKNFTYPGLPFDKNKIQHQNLPYSTFKFPERRYPGPMDVHSIQNGEIFPEFQFGQNEVQPQDFLHSNWKISGGSYPIPMDVQSIQNNFLHNEDIFPGFTLGQNKVFNNNKKFPGGSYPMPKDHIPQDEEHIFPAFPFGQNDNNFPQTNCIFSGPSCSIPLDRYSQNEEHIYPGFPFGQNSFEIMSSQIPGYINYARRPNPFNSAHSIFKIGKHSSPYFQDVNQMNFPIYDVKNQLSDNIPSRGRNFWNTISRQPYTSYINGRKHIKGTDKPTENIPFDVNTKPQSVIKIPLKNNGQFAPQAFYSMQKSSTQPENKTPAENYLEQTKTKENESPGSTNPEKINPLTNYRREYLNPLTSEFNLDPPLSSFATNLAGLSNPEFRSPSAKFVNPEIIRDYLSHSTNINTNLAGLPNPVNVNSVFSSPLLSDYTNAKEFSNGQLGGYTTLVGSSNPLNMGLPLVNGYTKLIDYENMSPDPEFSFSSVSFPSFNGYTNLAGSFSPIVSSGYNGFSSSLSVNTGDRTSSFNDNTNLAGSSNPDDSSGFNLPLVSGYTKVTKISNPVNNFPAFSGYSNFAGYFNPQNLNQEFAASPFSSYTKIEGPLDPENPWHKLSTFSGTTNFAGYSNPEFEVPSINTYTSEGSSNKLGSTSTNTNVNVNTNLAGPSNLATMNSGFGLPSLSSSIYSTGSSYPTNLNPEFNFPSFQGYTKLAESSNSNLNPGFGVQSYRSYKYSKPLNYNPEINYGYPESSSIRKYNTDSGSSNNNVNINNNTSTNSAGSSNTRIDQQKSSLNPTSFPNINLGLGANSAGSSNPPNLNSGIKLPNDDFANMLNTDSPNLAGPSNSLKLDPTTDISGGNLRRNKGDSSSSNTNTNINTNTNTNSAGPSNFFNLNPGFGHISNPGNIAGSLIPNIFSTNIPSASTNLAGASNSLNSNPAFGFSSNPGNIAGSLLPNIFSTNKPSASTNLAGASNFLNSNPAFELLSNSGNIAGSLLPNIFSTNIPSTSTNLAGASNSLNSNPAFGLLSNPGNIAGSLLPNIFSTNIPSASTNLAGASNSLNSNPAFGLSSNPGNIAGSLLPNIFSKNTPSSFTNLAGASNFLNLNPSLGLQGSLVPNQIDSSSSNSNVNQNTNTNLAGSFNPFKLNSGYDLRKSSILTNGSINSLVPNMNLGLPSASVVANPAISGLNGNLVSNIKSTISPIVTQSAGSSNLNTGIDLVKSTLTGSLSPSKINLSVPLVSSGTNLLGSNPLNLNFGSGNLFPKLGSNSANVNVNTNSNTGIDLLHSTRSLISKQESTTGEVPNFLSGLNIKNEKKENEKIPVFGDGQKLVSNAMSSVVSSGINPDSKSNGLLGGLGFF